ncbi:MAG: PilT protein domain protein [Rhizobium sp.]|nr:PilT protein domain protein [Rhizobium sp.]
MFLDASALVAVLAREPGYEALLSKVLNVEPPVLVSPMVRFEAALAVARTKAGTANHPASARAAFILAARDVVDGFLSELNAVDCLINHEIGAGALDAAATYGKVVGHTAALNMGDCFAYACAKANGEPLLYKGNDFSETDLA